MTTHDHTMNTAEAGWMVQHLVETINANRQYLSEIDGAIGDGDHGINMSKGFSLCGARLARLAEPVSLHQALDLLARVLMEDIGGSMGPLYGVFFSNFSAVIGAHGEVDKQLFFTALSRAVQSVSELGGAQPGDKTLIDTLVPACLAFQSELERQASFESCLKAMLAAAEAGMKATRSMQARIGRAARLGERSIGVLDAGACSSFLILQSLAQSFARPERARLQ